MCVSTKTFLRQMAGFASYLSYWVIATVRNEQNKSQAPQGSSQSIYDQLLCLICKRQTNPHTRGGKQMDILFLV